MLQLTLSSSILLAVLSTNALALPRPLPQGDDKSINAPVLFDDGVIGSITNEFYDRVPGVKYTVREWEPDWYPASCISESQSNNKCPVSEMKVYDVHYEDCPEQPWTMCRCSGSKVTPERLFEFYARVPVKARAEIRHMFAWPDQNGLAAYAFGPDIGITNQLENGGKQDMNVIIHETGHVLDQGASDSPEMLEAINKDSCVLRQYSLVSRGENLANLLVMTYFRMINREEYDRVYQEKGMDCLKHQLDFMERRYAEKITPGGQCPPRKHENSEKKHLPGGILTKKDLGLLKRELPPGNWTVHEDHGMYGEHEGSGHEGHTQNDPHRFDHSNHF